MKTQRLHAQRPGEIWPPRSLPGEGRPHDRPPAHAAGPAVNGKFLTVGGHRFPIKGVTYGSFQPNDVGEPFPPFERLRDDFERMRVAGVNTVRLYAPPSDRIADEAWRQGLKLVPDIAWGSRFCELDAPDRMKLLREWTRAHARRLADHPAVLMFSVGNEIPPLLTRWYGRHRIERHIGSLCEIVREEAPKALLTYVNHPPTEFLNLPFLDVVSYNVYLEDLATFRSYLARLHSLSGERPLFLAELGLDSIRNGEHEQANFLARYIRASFEKGLCGVAVYGWTDEWGIFDESIEGWAFGLTRKDRSPKPALEAVKHSYEVDLYGRRDRPWPKVSVVVATYNGARTLEDALGSLARLRYPDYEVIVVDDGSTDATPEIAERHDVRYVRAPSNGGLSRARNLGIDAAAGAIVAFTDDDARADPDWLYFLVTALEDGGAAGVGGPNLHPPEDGFVAHCVDLAPGNPTHVLLSDDEAEHVPGCNMAFWRTDLEVIGGFDPTHRAAGDDLDVCWKLLVRERSIAFSPAAQVWHHRRSSVRAFLRQQKGYGFAEAHLIKRYPGRFNPAGYPVWQGRIYEPRALSAVGGRLSLFRPRVYQGAFGSAPYQSLYEPARSVWGFAVSSIEWIVLTSALMLTGLLGVGSGRSGAVAFTARSLGVVGAVMLLTTLLAACFIAREKVRHTRWRGWRQAWATVIIAFLHFAQPLARAYGRVHGLWVTRGMRPAYPAEARVWGGLADRDGWLRRLRAHARDCGWRCEVSSEWGESDLVVDGPGPYRLAFISVAEENLERDQHFIRYRIVRRAKPWAVASVVGLTLGLPVLLATPLLAPLAIPAGGALARILSARHYVTRAFSQLALECAEARCLQRAPMD